MLGFFFVIKQYERGVQFRLGRVRNGVRGPGVILVIPLVDRVRRVSLRIVTLPIESQGIITQDNVSVGVSAVAYYRVEDAARSIVAIENVSSAISQIAQTTLRAVVGRNDLVPFPLEIVFQRFDQRPFVLDDENSRFRHEESDLRWCGKR